MADLIAVCSNKPRPMAQSSRSYSLKSGNAAWGRDVYHLRHSGMTTYCGRSLADWLVIGPIETLDSHCCTRCAKIAADRARSPDTAPTKFLGSYADSFSS